MGQGWQNVFVKVFQEWLILDDCDDVVRSSILKR